MEEASDIVIPLIVGHLRQGRQLEQSQYTIPTDEFKKIRLIALIVSSTLAGLLVIFIIGRCLRTKKFCRIFNCWSAKREYKKFKKQHNVPEPGNLTQLEFKDQVKKVIAMMNKSTQESNFSFLKAGLQHATKARVKYSQVGPYLYRIYLDGHDFEGTYEGKGYIVCKKQKPLIWFFKMYDDKKKAQQEGDFKNLVFESFYISNKGIGGKWFHVGLETSEMNSGKWKIVNSQVVSLAGTEKHLIMGDGSPTF